MGWEFGGASSPSHTKEASHQGGQCTIQTANGRLVLKLSLTPLNPRKDCSGTLCRNERVVKLGGGSSVGFQAMQCSRRITSLRTCPIAGLDVYLYASTRTARTDRPARVYAHAPGLEMNWLFTKSNSYYHKVGDM